MPLLVFNFKIHLDLNNFHRGKNDYSLSEIEDYIIQFIEHFQISRAINIAIDIDLVKGAIKILHYQKKAM
tara:strand:- start:2602 stop:2811 length:210 start_codon:yes stop_codon:yes gene_type:complete